MAVYHWIRELTYDRENKVDPPTKLEDLKSHNAAIATVGRPRDYNDDDPPIYKPPCEPGGPDHFGCCHFVEVCGLRVVCEAPAQAKMRRTPINSDFWFFGKRGDACVLPQNEKALPLDVQATSIDFDCKEVAPAVNAVTPKLIGGYGDSYGAGIGAGTLQDQWCGRYDGSWQWVVSKDPMFANVPFDWVSCSGATSQDVVAHQVDTIKNPDFAFLNIGGNNAKLGDLLNNCVYNFFMPGKCEDTIKQSQDATKQLQGDVEDLLEKMLAKMPNGDSKIFVPGYATFFEPDTPQCNGITFDYRQREDTNAPKLSSQQRKQYNDLTLAVNTAVEQATWKYGDRVIYVDVDEAFTAAKGRFCNEGITEPDLDRKETLFFNYFENQTAEVHTELRRSVETLPSKGTFERQIHDWVVRDYIADPPERLRNELRKRIPQNIPPQAKGSEKSVVGDIAWQFIPDAIKRVFHPVPSGHQIIATQILNAVKPYMDATTYNFDECTPKPTTTPGPSSSPPSNPAPTTTKAPAPAHSCVSTKKDDVKVDDLYPDSAIDKFCLGNSGKTDAYMPCDVRLGKFCAWLPKLSFKAAKSAPPRCGQLFKDHLPDDATRALCTDPLKNILDKCKRVDGQNPLLGRGGTVDDECGTWTITNCKNGAKDCGLVSP